MAVAIGLVIAGTRGRSEVPGRLQNGGEYVYESLSSFGMGLGGPRAKGLHPLFASLFVLIILSNWSAAHFPPVGKVEAPARSHQRHQTSPSGWDRQLPDLPRPSGIRSLGVGGDLGKFFSLREFRNGVGAGSSHSSSG